MTDNAKKVSELPISNTAAQTDRVLIVKDPNGSPSTRTITVGNLIGSLPPANTSVAGVVKIDGDTIFLNGNGAIAANASPPNELINGSYIVNLDTHGIVNLPNSEYGYAGLYSNNPVEIYSESDNAGIALRTKGNAGDAMLVFEPSGTLHFPNDAITIGQGMGPSIISNTSLFNFSVYDDGQNNYNYGGSIAYPNTYQIFAEFASNTGNYPSASLTLNNSNTSIDLYTNNANWSFGGDGNLHFPNDSIIIGELMGPTIYSNTSLFHYSVNDDGVGNFNYAGSIAYPNTYQIFTEFDSNTNVFTGVNLVLSGDDDAVYVQANTLSLSGPTIVRQDGQYLSAISNDYVQMQYNANVQSSADNSNGTSWIWVSNDLAAMEVFDTDSQLRAALNVNGTANNITIHGDVIPTANVTYNLGSNDSYWNTAYTNLIKLPVGSIIQHRAASIEVIVADLTLAQTVDFSTGEGDNLNIGDYGLSQGIAHPWIVYQFTTTPSPALQLDDVIFGEGIPFGSTVLFVGTGSYSDIVITNIAQPDILPAQPNALVHIVRPIVNAGLDLSTLADTNINLTPGANGYIINGSSIIPLESNMYDLGSPLRRFKTLWLGGSSIYIADETLGVDQRLTARDGNLVVAGGAGLEVGEFTFHDNQILIANAERTIIVGSNNATGPVQFNRPLKVVAGNTGLTAFDVTRAGLVNINTPQTILTTQAALDINGSSAANSVPRNFNGTLLQLTGQDNTSARVSIDAFGDSTVYPVIAGRSSSGTIEAPTATSNNDTLFRLSTQGYGDTGFVSSIGRLNIQATQTFTDTAAGTRARFQLTPNNSVTIQSVSMDVDSYGVSFIGNPNGGVTFPDSSRQNTAFNDTSAVTKINVGTGLTQSSNVGVVGIDSQAVLSITGTNNQVSVANVGGNYTLTLPQNIDANATVQFNTVTVENLNVNGGTTTANNLAVTDKVIHLAVDSETAPQIDGGGITLGNTAADYTVNFLYDLNNHRWDTDGAGLKTHDLTANNIAVNSVKIDNSLHVGLAYIGYDYPNADVQLDCNTNDYNQVVQQNHNGGTQASADYVAVNDVGSDSNNYIDMGINSSTYANNDYSMGGPSDGYLYVNGGDLDIATQTGGKVVKIYTGNTTADALRATFSNTGLTVVGAVNATSFNGSLSGTANNTSFVGSVTAANVVSNTQLQSNLANYQSTAGLSANVAALTANNTSFVGTISAANVVSNNQLQSNLANYQTAAGLSANVAVLTANNTNFVGTVSAANVVSNSQLSSNLANYAALSGASFTNNVSVSNTLTVAKLSANGTLGTAGQILTSNGTTTYWTTPASGAVNVAAQYIWTNTHTFNANVTFSSEINLHNILANNVAGTNGQVLVANSADGMYWADLKTHKAKKVKHKDGSYDPEIDATVLQDTMTFVDGAGIVMSSNTLNQTITINSQKTIRDAGATNAIIIDFSTDDVVLYQPTNSSTITMNNYSTGRTVQVWAKPTTTKAMTMSGITASQATGGCTAPVPVSGQMIRLDFLATTTANTGVYVSVIR